MRLIHVIPLTRGGLLGELSYFSSQKLLPGMLITIPIRNKQTPALVLRSEEVSDAKARIRASAFRIKKIPKVSTQTFLPFATLAAARLGAEYFVTTQGAVLFAITPIAILKSSADVSGAQGTSKQEKDLGKQPDKKFGEKRQESEVLVYQGVREKRITQYKHLVREAFAHKQSVVVLAPSLQDAEYLYEKLSRGIPQFSFLLHSSLTQKASVKTWQDALAEKHPILVVLTPGFLSLPRYDIGVLIIEREASAAYQSPHRPFVDFTKLAEFLALEHGWRLVRADIPLSVSTIFGLKKGNFQELDIVPMRIANTAESSLIDMRKTHIKGSVQPFQIIGDTLRSHLKQMGEYEKKSVLFVARRGLATTTHCGDCGETVTCLACDASVVLHKGANENMFVCHSCGAMRSAHERCRHCNSWRLQSIGIGSERIEQETAALFPNRPLFLLDKDHVTTHTKAKEMSEQFYQSKDGILIGTEMMLSYLTSEVALTAVVSADSLFAIPNWNMYERLFSMLLRLRERASEQFLVQSRSPEHTVLRHALSGDVGTFYREEIADRKQFQYPPFATLVKCTVHGTQATVAKDMERLETLLAPFDFVSIPHIFATGVQQGNRSFRMHGFLRLTKQTWPTPELSALLSSLPPSITVYINPSSIL